MRLFCSYTQAIFAISLLLVTQQAVTAKGAPRKLKPLSKPQEPIFDTTYVPKPSHFELKIKYSQIVFPKEREPILTGETKVIDLHADDSRNMLRGQVSAEEPESTIHTREYGVKPRFSVDLRKMEAKYAPDIARLMYAEIAAARRRAAGIVAREEPLMKKELQARLPQLDSIPVHKASASSKPLEAGLDQSQKELQKEKPLLDQFNAAKQEAKQSANAKMPQLSAQTGQTGQMPQLPTQTAEMPQFPKLPIGKINFPDNKNLIPNFLAKKPDTTDAEKQLAGELRNAKTKAIPSASDLSAELARAKRQAQDAVKQAQPSMDTILTYLRKSPSTEIPAPGKAPAPTEEDSVSVIKWDEWHARFAGLARNPILNAVNKSNNPSGSNTVEITVRRNHSLSVRVTQAGNTAFDQAIVQAYQSLDGNTGLEFPAGSKRNAITFSIDNKHTGGVPKSVKSQTSIGDQEVLRQNR